MKFADDLNSDQYIPPLMAVIKKLKPKTGLEIGFCWGMSAYAYLEACRGALLSIDLDDEKDKADLFKKRYGERWNILYGRSPYVLKGIEDKFDWIYVDGDHSYESARADLEGVLPLSKSVIACDDYGNPFGVTQAVDEFCEKHGFTIKPIEGHNNGAVLIVK